MAPSGRVGDGVVIVGLAVPSVGETAAVALLRSTDGVDRAAGAVLSEESSASHAWIAVMNSRRDTVRNVVELCHLLLSGRRSRRRSPW
jgi:hypothetical protein